MSRAKTQMTSIADADGMSIRPVTGNTGAEILGVDLRYPLSDEAYVQIRSAFNAYGVIFFRDQDLTPDQYVAFGQRFGAVSATKYLHLLEENPLVQVLERNAGDNEVIGEMWHSDQAFRPVPRFGTMLYAKEVPDYGGDTAFVNTVPAYETLSDGLKQALEGLRAVHTMSHMQSYGDESDTAVHPVVMVHPESGRKILFVSPGFTERFDGWTEEESSPLLSYLYEQVLRPEFQCRFRWEENSLVFWDNRQVWHYAVNDRPIHRVVHRLVIE